MKVHARIRLFAGMVMIVSMILTGCAANRSATAPAAPATGVPEAAYIKDVTFDKADGKERVLILVSEMPEYTISRESDTALTLKLKNVFVPDNLKKKLGEGKLANIRNAVLSQAPVEGVLWAYMTVTLNEMVPYRISQDGKNIVLTCDVSSLPVKTAVSDPAVMQARSLASSILGGEEQESAVAQTGPIKYTGAKVSLNFQDAQIKSVFRSLSEVSGYNIVAGPGVEQKVTVFMKDVPWDQALDTILEINGLGKKTANNVITVLPLEELKKAEEEQQKKDVSQGKLRQIAIEAKIVEVNTNATRQLGIQWGYGYQNTWGGRDYGMLAGTAPVGAITTLPGNIGLTGSNVAVNFPGVDATTVATPGIGLIVGADKFVLDAKLNALETSGDGKVISSPKVTTLDNVKATIKQGQQIPYAVTDKEGNRSIEFKDAALLLEVKPTVTPEGQISMLLKASNDYPDWTNTNTNKENPPINTNSVESTVLVNNGDTLVVGGVYKTEDQETLQGVPWLSDIPVMGWLFKTKTTVKVKRELLIFVTPRIIGEESKKI